jgi:hypothetical protein
MYFHGSWRCPGQLPRLSSPIATSPRITNHPITIAKPVTSISHSLWRRLAAFQDRERVVGYAGRRLKASESMQRDLPGTHIGRTKHPIEKPTHRSIYST